MEGLLYRTSTRDDGNMSLAWGDEEEVLKNRAAFYDKADVEASGVVLMEVEHKDAVLRVGKEKGGQTLVTEALMSDERGVTLALLTADCFPVAYYDARHRAIALAHCGWRPVDRLLPKKVLASMTEAFGTNPKDVDVRIGPGIYPESYVQKEFPQADDPLWAKYVLKEDDGVRINLFGYLYDQLTDAGVPAHRIEVDPVDTAMAYEYFSHYRAVRTGEPEGRFMTVLALAA